MFLLHHAALLQLQGKRLLQLHGALCECCCNDVCCVQAVTRRKLLYAIAHCKEIDKDDTTAARLAAAADVDVAGSDSD